MLLEPEERGGVLHENVCVQDEQAIPPPPVAFAALRDGSRRGPVPGLRAGAGRQVSGRRLGGWDVPVSHHAAEGCRRAT